MVISVEIRGALALALAIFHHCPDFQIGATGEAIMFSSINHDSCHLVEETPKSRDVIKLNKNQF